MRNEHLFVTVGDPGTMDTPDGPAGGTAGCDATKRMAALVDQLDCFRLGPPRESD